MLKITRDSKFHIIVKYHRQKKHYDLRELVKRVDVLTKQINNLKNANMGFKNSEKTDIKTSLEDQWRIKRREIRRLIKLIVDEFPNLRSYVPWL